MKTYLISILFIALLSICSVSSAQRTCGIDTNLEEFQKSNPKEYKRIMELELTKSKEGAAIQQRIIDSNGKIIIPVVVHVLHGNSPIGANQNISNAQVLSQIDVLNEDFRRLNADRVNTPVPFQSVAADVNIEFRLACIDPNGNATTGITRTNVGDRIFTVGSTEQSTGIKFNSTGGKDAWDTSKYLNIWVCVLNTGSLGYSQRPSQFPFTPNTDGVVIHFAAFGRVGFLGSRTNKGRTAVHEIGHWLDLNHIWGDNDCGDDEVIDTPFQHTQTSQLDCPSFPRRTASCNLTTNGEMFMNYMDYSNDVCMNLFTQGQKTRMRNNFLIGGARHAFINNYFKIKDVSQNTCIPSGSTIQLQNVHCLPVEWTAIGATKVSESNQSVTLTGSGTVTLTATSGNYTDTKTFDLGNPIITTSDIGKQFCKTNYYETQNYIDLVGSGFAPLAANFEVEKITNNFAFYVTQNKMFIQPHTAGFITFRVRVQGYCGWSAWKLFQYPVTNCGGGGFFKVYPNPAKESLTIDFDSNKENNKNEDQKQENLGEVKIELYNSYQKLVFETTFKEEQKDRKLKIDTNKLPNGVYYLKIINNKEVYTERIVIEN